jgi:hypothetical protein
VAAVAVGLYVVVAPLAASRYPPMTDLPFHAAFGATFLHYWDPSYHLREQFTLNPLSHGYMSLYGMIAGLLLVLPVATAVKTAVAVHLLLVPAGLAVLFYGAKKSPLLGLLGLGMCWGNLTHWGFLNYLGAIGLMAMTVGLALLLVDRPSRGRQIAVFLGLLSVYFAHVFRYPFAVAAAVGTAVVMFPATRRLRPLVLPVVVATIVFVVWWKTRPASFGVQGNLAEEVRHRVLLGLANDRLKGGEALRNALTDGFKDDGVKRALLRYFEVCWAVAAVAAVHAILRRAADRRRFTAWDVGVTLVPLCCAAVFFALFLVLPLFIGSWFYVYPREATAATVLLMGACPDLPRTRWLRVSLVAAMCAAGILVSREVALHYADFAQSSEDFYTVTRRISRAPRLFYMIADHDGSSRSVSPFSHMPAYVQAEKGGWLSWSFAVWEHSPVTYRKVGDPEAVPIPPFYPRWDPAIQKPFYDWILIRQEQPADQMFVKDPAIELVDHAGRWWLYHRAASP